MTGALAAPDVGGAQVSLGVGHDHRAEAPLTGRTFPVRRQLGVLGRVGQHERDVGVGVVVVEDGRVETGRIAAAVGAEEVGGRVDGVGRVVGRGRVGPAGRHRAVGGEGGRFELHRTLGAHRVRPRPDPGQGGLPEIGLDLGDPGQDGPGQVRTLGRHRRLHPAHVGGRSIAHGGDHGCGPGRVPGVGLVVPVVPPTVVVVVDVGPVPGRDRRGGRRRRRTNRQSVDTGHLPDAGRENEGDGNEPGGRCRPLHGGDVDGRPGQQIDGGGRVGLHLEAHHVGRRPCTSRPPAPARWPPVRERPTARPVRPWPDRPPPVFGPGS